MKKATNDTRIRITVKMPVAGDTTLTMTACAWNDLSSVYYQAARRYEHIGCGQVSKEYRDIADRIYNVLVAHGYYDDKGYCGDIDDGSGVGQAFNPD